MLKMQINKKKSAYRKKADIPDAFTTAVLGGRQQLCAEGRIS